MFNGGQIHLALNHLPLVGAFFACGTAVIGLLLKNATVRRTGLGLLTVAALTAGPAFWTGEPAEDFLEKAAPAAFDKHVVHEHEEAAEFAAIVLVLAGIAAATALMAARRNPAGSKLESGATAVALVVGLVAFTAMARTGHLGGLIRHEELRSVAAPTT